jgi:hypothetical protein
MLITGTGSGIGRLCAIEFAKVGLGRQHPTTPLPRLDNTLLLIKLGARVVLWDINENANRETRNLIETAGYEVSALCGL